MRRRLDNTPQPHTCQDGQHPERNACADVCECVAELTPFNVSWAKADSTGVPSAHRGAAPHVLDAGCRWGV